MTWLLNWYDRLWFRLRHGEWCRHPRMTEWRIEDAGRFKSRWCPDCRFWEST
jgi:hypothetical protein